MALHLSKNSITIIIILLFIIFGILIFYFTQTSSTFTSTTININNQQINLEIAKTNSQKAKGLSGRTSLCSDCGMIFIFNKEGIYPFWMKDTLIPLDMIWLNSQGLIVSILTAQPEPNTPITQLKLYQNQMPAKYVIELNANRAQELNLKIGDKMELPSLR
jgi:hypothetical protein